jgi:hypothetical protein
VGVHSKFFSNGFAKVRTTLLCSKTEAIYLFEKLSSLPFKPFFSLRYHSCFVISKPVHQPLGGDYLLGILKTNSELAA